MKAEQQKEQQERARLQAEQELAVQAQVQEEVKVEVVEEVDTSKSSAPETPTKLAPVGTTRAAAAAEKTNEALTQSEAPSPEQKASVVDARRVEGSAAPEARAFADLHEKRSAHREHFMQTSAKEAVIDVSDASDASDDSKSKSQPVQLAPIGLDRAASAAEQSASLAEARKVASTLASHGSEESVATCAAEGPANEPDM